jgi:hypothetical protein
MTGYGCWTLDSPYRRWVKITPDDDADLPGGVCLGLLVGGAGTANLIDQFGVETTSVPLQAGVNRLMVKRVKTGGTASEIWALYNSPPE